MRKSVLYIAMSLDGYIADTDGGVSWLSGDGSEPGNEGSFDAFYSMIDTVVMGRRTYDQIVEELSPGGWPYPDRRCIAVTDKDDEPVEGAEFSHDDPAGLIRGLKGEPGRDIWVCGGSDIACQLLRAGMIDRIWVSVIPKLLGKGIRLFADVPVTDLRLIGTRVYNGITDLVYERR